MSRYKVKRSAFVGKGIGHGHTGSTGHMPPILPMQNPPLIGPVVAQANTRAYTMGQCTIFYSIYNGHHHLSIAHPDRLPTWDEAAHVRYALMPQDITVALLLPKPEDYIDLHTFCLHLHQVNMTP